MYSRVSSSDVYAPKHLTQFEIPEKLQLPPSEIFERDGRMSSAETNLSTETLDTRQLDFQQLLARCTAAITGSCDELTLINTVCSAARLYLQVETLSYWGISPERSIFELASSASDSRNRTRSTGSEAPCAVRAAIDQTKALAERSSVADVFTIAAPLIIRGRTEGALAAECHTPDRVDHVTHQLSAICELMSAYLQVQRNGCAAERDRRRAEELVTLAQELNSPMHMGQLVASLTSRVTRMLGADASVLAIAHRGQFTVTKSTDPELDGGGAVARKLAFSIPQILSRCPESIIFGRGEELFPADVASLLRWNTAAVARLQTNSGELLAVLLVGNCGPDFGTAERNLLEAVCGHAAVALENSRLFSRMDAANRHWIEIFDSISDFIVVHDEHCSVLRVNRSFADLMGVKPSQMIGISMNSLLSIGDKNPDGCPFCHLHGDSDEYIHAGRDRTYLISTSRIHGAASDALQTIHVLKDITERREAERRYRELFDNIQEGLYFSSPDGRFIEVNNALVRMLGYESREDLLQVDIARQLFVSPEQRDKLEDAVIRNHVLRNYEIVMRRKDGTLIHTLQNAFAVRDPQGNAVQYRGLILDITELKQFQAELQRERDFSSKILNNTQSMILVVDTAGLISYANRRCFTAGGYRPEALLGTRLSELIAPSRRDHMIQALEATLEGNPVDNLELPVIEGAGRVAQFSVNLSPMRDEQGAVNSIVVVMTDITDAAMLQAKLVHTEKMAAVGQLVSGVAHEVNNPLTAVLGFTDLLLDSPTVPDDAKADLMIVMQEAQRTKQIVQNLLSFARQTPAKRGLVQVNSILDRTVALRAYDFANHNVEVTQELDPKLPDILADGHQLQQVFLNIINNAYDAVCETGRSGSIRITTAKVGSGIEITLRDNGPGITSPDRIFDPFFTTKEVGKGTGLGLSICYGIVREHDGEISCHNNADGPGATFIVRLPHGTEKALAAVLGGQK
jgi:PAS domain S-box-containing protein